jgi:hypothetical protein
MSSRARVGASLGAGESVVGVGSCFSRRLTSRSGSRGCISHLGEGAMNDFGAHPSPLNANSTAITTATAISTSSAIPRTSRCASNERWSRPGVDCPPDPLQRSLSAPRIRRVVRSSQPPHPLRPPRRLPLCGPLLKSKCDNGEVHSAVCGTGNDRRGAEGAELWGGDHHLVGKRAPPHADAGAPLSSRPE